MSEPVGNLLLQASIAGNDQVMGILCPKIRDIYQLLKKSRLSTAMPWQCPPSEISFIISNQSPLVLILVHRDIGRDRCRLARKG